MIVDFLKIKEQLHHNFRLSIDREIKKRIPFHQLVGPYFIHEGDQYYSETVDKQEIKDEPLFAEAGFEVEQIHKITYSELMQKGHEVADSMARQINTNTFKKMSQDLDKAGQTIAWNQPLSPEIYLEALVEIIEIDFDNSRNKPVIPVMLAPEKVIKRFYKMLNQMPEIEKEDFLIKEKQILDKKWEDYLKRQSCRRIID